MTRHISEVQYNNWGNEVWSSLLTIQGTGNCSGNNRDNEYYKACIQKDIKDAYDLQDMWNSDYWKTYHDGKLTGVNTSDKNKFQKLGSWEKFREVCTKGIDDLIKQQDWNKLSNALGTTSSGEHNPTNDKNDITYSDCLNPKTITK